MLKDNLFLWTYQASGEIAWKITGGKEPKKLFHAAGKKIVIFIS